jgi:hypothetical protein
MRFEAYIHTVGSVFHSCEYAEKLTLLPPGSLVYPSTLKTNAVLSHEYHSKTRRHITETRVYVRVSCSNFIHQLTPPLPITDCTKNK